MNQDIDLNDMLVFAKVAEKGGISAAARELQQPKSRVSRRMAALESSLGVRLLERTSRAVNLTEAGNIYYQHCKRVQEEASSATESINQMLDTPRGHLRITASVTFGQYFLAPHIAEFIEKYPQISLDLNLNNRRVDLITEGFDVALRVGKLNDSSLISKHLGGSHAQLFAAPQYLDTQSRIDKLEDLENHQLLYMSDSDTGNHWTLQNQAGQQKQIAVYPKIRINDLTTLQAVAENGGGIAWIPSYLAHDALENERLTCVLPEWTSPHFNFYAIFPSRQGATQKVRAWIDFISEKMKANADIKP